MPQRYLKNSTAKLGETLQSAIIELANMRKSLLSAEMLLLSLVEQKDSIALKVFDEIGLDTPTVRREIVDRVVATTQKLPNMTPQTKGNIKMSQDVQELFAASDEERKQLGDAYISTGALFLACVSGKVKSVNAVTEAVGLEYDACLRALNTIRGNKKIDKKDDETRQSMLEQFTTDITAMARRGVLDPVVGRESEISRVIEILSRRKKNNPVLIGEPGVGKTVIVEGLARQIVAADVPEYLLHRRILSLEMGTLIAGAKMQGEFEERLKQIVDEVVASEGEIILFLDELHTLVGTGRSGGGLDASNMLKPALSKGVLQCIGATTTREFKQYIEADKALARRFQPVAIAEPTVEQTLGILSGLKERYEAHHQIEYTDAAIKAAAELSSRYITDRFLPDKAIDLMDEAGAAKRLKVIYTPPEIRTLENERQDFLAKKAEAFNAQDFEKMAQFQMEVSRLDTKLAEARAAISESLPESDRRVDEEDIAAIVSRLTGVPVRKMVTEEAERLRDLESRFAKRVIGQSHVLATVSAAIRRNRAGLRKFDKPVASFLFLGPTGVGKTEVAKAIAAEILDSEEAIIRVDMSEYMEKHTVSKMIGSPPGYVGYGEGGQLTEKVRRSPYSVVLFDEFEKAHPDVYNLLLQVLDEGWLTDGEGQRVSFRNCVIIGTSNIGSDVLTDRKRPVGIGAQAEDWDKDAEREAVMKEVRQFLRPEFINRLDEVIIFNRLTEQELSAILDLQITDLAQRLLQQGWQLQVTPAVKTMLKEGVEKMNFGARPLRRRLEKFVENELALFLINSQSEAGKLTVDLDDGGAVRIQHEQS